MATTDPGQKELTS